MTAREEQAKRLIEALEESGYEPRSYSGRGMYGKTCVSVRDVSAWELAKILFSEEYDGEFMNLPTPKEDAMGKGAIYYWPTMPWVGTEDTESEDDEEEGE